MSKDRKERLKELLDKQKRKEIEEEERKQYERVIEAVNELFPNIYSEKEVEISWEKLLFDMKVIV